MLLPDINVFLNKRGIKKGIFWQNLLKIAENVNIAEIFMLILFAHGSGPRTDVI